MNDTPRHEHPNAERLQAFLDGALPHGERRRVEEHLGGCARCASEVEGWQALFQDLEGLPRLVPHEGFQARVMADVELPGARPLAARVGAFLKGLVPSLPSGLTRGSHPSAGDLQDLVEGLLPDRAQARVRSHTEGCSACAHELAVWRELAGALDGLGHLDPSEGFRDEVMATWRLERALDSLGHMEPSQGFAARVMAGVRIPEPATAAAPATTSPWDRLLAAARGMVPQTRRAWAAASGFAVTPAVTLGLVLWSVFSHPTLTASSLASFAWWKVSELAVGAWGAASTFAVESTGAFQIWETLGALPGDPGTIAFAGLAFAVGSLVSLWILYTNLVDTHAVDGRYAHAHF